jgi:hypothetical protein
MSQRDGAPGPEPVDEIVALCRQVKRLAVLDSSTVVSAVGWQGEARRVFSLLAKRAFTSCTTVALSEEWPESVAAPAALPKWLNPNSASCQRGPR